MPSAAVSLLRRIACLLLLALWVAASQHCGLEAAGLWERLEPKLVYGETIRQAVQFLQSGAVEAGIIARSVADVPGIAYVPMRKGALARVDYEGGVIRPGRGTLRFLVPPEILAAK